MFNKFKLLFSLIGITFVAAIATGFSMFYLGEGAKDEVIIENSTTTGSDDEVFADNILENYEFGAKRNLNRTYTYIFFPSTLYNEFYHDGITDPENVFGYNEVVLDDFGIPRTDQNGDVMYDIVTDGRRGVSYQRDLLGNVTKFTSNLTNNTYITYNDLLSRSSNGLNYKTAYYWAADGSGGRNTGVEQSSYNRNDPYIINHPNFGESYVNEYNYGRLNKTDEYFSPIYNDSTYSIDLNFPSAEFHDKNTFMTKPLKSHVEKFIDGSNSGLFDMNRNNNEGYYYRYDEQFQKRRQYRNDRFGFWSTFYDWDYSKNGQKPDSVSSGSRYLPIKITVNGNLTPDTLAEILPTLLNASFDNNAYFDSTSNVWTYNSQNNEAYTTAVGGFTAKDIDNIFDIMQNPANYADSNGVIRLYPVFSNGKNTSTQDLSQGARDAIKAEYIYKSDVDTVDKIKVNTKLTYATTIYRSKTDSAYKYTYNNGQSHYDVNYAVLKNLELKKGFYESITFYICPSNWNSNKGQHEFEGTWYSQFTITSEQINNFIDRFGEGLYSFYFFIGNNSDHNNQGSNYSDFSNLSDIGEYAVLANSSFTALREKNLLTYTDIGSGDHFKYMSNNNNNPDSHKQQRPIALYLEKVTNMRLVSNIDIKEEGNGSPSSNQDWDAIDESIHSGMINADNFVIASGVKTYNKDNNGNQIEPDDITSPYVYIIQNADFRYVNHLYFQIRFSNQYINDSLHVVTNFKDYENDPNLVGLTTPKNYVSYEVAEGVTLELYSQNTIVGNTSKDMFIQNANATGTITNSDGSPTTITRQGFKLKDFYSRGVYDIMLVANGSYKRDENNTVRVYNMYINRHTNSFIKLFDGNPGTFKFNGSGISETFVSHKKQENDDNLITGEPQESYTDTPLIWEGQTYLGEMLTTNENDVNKEGQVTFLNALNTYFNEATNKKSEGTYPIIDAVTGQTIAYYKYNGNGSGQVFNASGSTDNDKAVDLFMILKNYVLYIGNPVQQ